MKTINQVITQTDNGKKPNESTARWPKRTEVLVSALFVRFADLYGDLAQSKGLSIKREGSSEYTREFQLWCMKLKDLKDEDFAQGIENIEADIAHNSNIGKKSYPPNYAEFIGLTQRKPQTQPAIYRSWAGLPAPTMTVEQRKEKMSELRSKLGL